MSNIDVNKSEEEGPVPAEWRDTFRWIVAAFKDKNYSLQGIDGVVSLSQADARNIEKNVRLYGEELDHLPDETWQTSVSRWMGSHWDVLVDLFTTPSGLSDHVISSRVRKNGGAYLFIVDSVHVT